MFEFLNIHKNKFVRKGECKKCGNCCRNITFVVDGELIKTEKQFEELKEWKRYYHNFFPSGFDERGAMLFTCKCLKPDNTCSMYWLRAKGCREYPKVDKKFLVNGGKPLDGCGFYFEPEKKFEEYLKSEM